MSGRLPTHLDACRAAALFAPRASARTALFAFRAGTRTLPAAAAALGALPASAWAAEESSGNLWLDLLWKAVNLLVLAGLIAYFARKPLGAALRKMAKETYDTWNGAHRAAEAARAEMAEQRKQIDGLAGQLARMVGDARADGEREQARLVQDARVQADRILALAQQRAEQEVAKARTELHRQIAEEAMRLAEQMIRDQATPEQRRKLLEGYLREMESRP
jgi:F-type H+-transporting ATPase subunit b